ncbi:hypothetical protein Back11_20300 [Paenibacillus baekrokdamisoli]|uniref:Uncharacterized protein n=1 Tax=Paenibacillus baekrokdamisoli TaxID=1712516 RepID=A0A3G9IX12_9BACL|nr:YqkE family protein [Paenibacillus baekrokdamisoli]MBB3069964.1 hypothetical protein [Paenibacillus baekrokdamisoli]BBH20685.1 hypothetical protein Back11_20300 [Paenibacillus baekrokdamisoli]
MAKKRTNPAPAAAKDDKPATLQDLLRPEILDKLKAKANELKTAEETRKEDIRKQAEEAHQAEQKRLENDFEHLLNNSKMDWRKNK